MNQQEGNDIRKMIDDTADRISSLIHEEGTDPLDGDETDRIGRLLTLKLDWRQGNVTREEYEKQLRSIEKV
jgi:hypothetical protein